MQVYLKLQEDIMSIKSTVRLEPFDELNAVNKYQVKSGRTYDKVLDNSIVNEVKYINVDESLEKCLKKFILHETNFYSINYLWEVCCDRIAVEKIHIKEIMA